MKLSILRTLVGAFVVGSSSFAGAATFSTNINFDEVAFSSSLADGDPLMVTR